MTRIRISILMIFTGSAILASAQRPAAVANWSEFHQTNMQRWNQSETVLGVSNAKNLKLKWSFATNAQASPCPTIVNGVAYVSSDDGVFYALSVTTGALIVSSPAVANGVVYVGSWFPSGKNIYAINANSGAVLWTYNTGSYVWSSPSVVNGTLYIGSDTTLFYAFGLN